MNNRIAHESPVHTHRRGLDRVSLKTLVAAIGGALGVGLVPVAQAQVPASTSVVNSVNHALKNASTVTQNSNTWSVLSNTTSGNTAFNSFDTFNVAKNNTVNLYRPSTTSNLVNLVWNAAAEIDGTINSYTYTAGKNGPVLGNTISGSVFFADPYGVVVGGDAVLNVGALSLSAPTEKFMESMLDSSGNPVSANVTTLLQGQEPVNDTATANACANGTAMICVDGAVNATNAVRIHATTIEVGGKINVAGTGTDTLATAVNVAGSTTPVIETDGNTIRLIAEDSNTADTGGGDAAANAAVTVSGKLITGNVTQPKSNTSSPDSWGEVALTATTSATSDYKDPTKKAALKSAGDLLLDQSTYNSSPVSLIENNAGTLQNDINLATADKVGQLAYVRAFSTANVELQSGAIIKASGNVLLQSGTTASATTDATSKQTDGSIPAMLTGMYGAVYSKANTLIDSGASVTSAGNVTALSTTTNTLGVSANTIATKSTSVLGATVAWSQAAVAADTEINGSVSAQGLAIGAQNSNDFSTKANASTSNTGGSIGLAGAVSRQTVNATALLGSAPSMSGTGDITIAAETDTNKNETVASTGTTDATPPASSADNSGDNADLTGSMGNVTSNTGSDGKTGSSTGGGLGASLPFKIGAAVAFTDSSNTATATTAPGLIFTTPGNLAVQAIVSDAGIHNSAKSETASKEDSGAEGASGSGGSSGGGSGGTGTGSGGSSGGSGGGSTTVNVSAAVAYGNYTHNADAEIGAGDKITALNIGVDSQVVVPFDWTFGQTSLDSASLGTLSSMGNSLDDFKKGAEELKNLVTTAKAAPDEIMDGVTSYAGAFGDGSTVAIGGSVDYFGMTNTNRAWVGSGSSLTSTAAASEGTWQSSLGWLTGAIAGNNLAVGTTPTDTTATTPGDAGSSNFTWSQSVDVLASTTVATFNLVGDLTPWSPTTAGSSAAIGGAFNYGGYANTTTAGLDSGVNVVSNNAVAVNANGADTLFVLSPISGKGGSAAILGMVALTDVSDQTHATVSGSDNITATALGVNATNPLMVWSLTGALAMSSGAGIGISVGINDVTTNTLAMVGDNSADESSTPSPAPAETGGTIKSGTLTIAANTSGEAGGLSVAGSSISDAKPDPGNGTGDSAAPSGSGAPGAGLLSMLKSVGSMADKLRGGADGFQSALGKVDELTGGTVSNSGVTSGVGKAASLLDKASSALSAATSGVSGLQTVVGKLSSLGKKTGSSGSGSGSGSSSSSSSFGIGISGAASVNMAKLGTQATLDGAKVEDQAGTAAADTVTLLAMNSANLVSAAGGAALSRTSNSSGGGDLAGAVAYSSVGDTTSAVMGGADAPVIQANDVTVQALDNSQQIDAGIGVAAQIGGSGTTTTVAGSVSIGSSKNQTTASLGDSTLTGSSAASNAVQVTAYDAAAIGIGAGSFGLNTSSGDSVNGAVSLTYADIANATTASVDNASISDYGNFSLNALDGAQIVAVAATGSVSTGENSNSLTGAVVVNQIGDATTASLGGGASVNVTGSLGVQASAVEPGSSTLTSLDLPGSFGAPASSYFDFSGGQLTQTLTNASNAGANAGTTATNAAAGNSSKGTATGTSNGWGSSIIAVAGDLGVSGNNVGLSFAYNKIANTHQVTIDDATLSTAGDIGLNAQDNTRIIGVAAGLGVATGDFAGMGSATYNSIGNTTGVVLGAASDKSVLTNLTGSTISATAGDQSKIYSLAGSAAISTGTAAVGGAVGYNNIGDTTQATATNTAFTTTATDDKSGITLQAQNDAGIMAGALGAAISGGDVGLAVSFGWNQTGNTTLASLTGGSVNGNLDAATGNYDGVLNVTANDGATIQALSGAAAVSGSGAAAAAVSVQEIGDSTQANLQNALVQIGDANVTASTTALEQSIALGVAVSGDGSGTGSVAYNCIGDSLSNGNCQDSSTPSTSQPAGTSAFVSGIYSGTVANPAPAAVSDTLDVGATDSSEIQTLAVGVAVAGDAALGASVAVSDIGTATSATIGTAAPTNGSNTTLTQLDVGNATNVKAASNATIESLAVGAAVSGDVSLAGSSSTNLIANTVNAAMTNVSTGATSAAAPAGTFNSNNATGIIATNGAQISSLAGALAGSGSVAIGAAVAVNDIGTNTTASFDGSGGGTNSTSDKPSTWYQVGSLTVQAGATNPGTPSNLPGTLSTADTNNANIQTIAVAGGASGTAAVTGSIAVNKITGNTLASIDQNAGVVANNSVGVLAGNDQGINVFAGSASLSGSFAVGAGVVVNMLSGDTNAAIDDSSVTAYANGTGLTVANGTPSEQSSLDGDMDVTNSLGDIFSTFKNGTKTVAGVTPSLASNTTTITGVAVNAVNQQHASTLSLGVSAGGEIAGTAEVGVNVIGGTTSADIDNGSQINQLTPASNTTLSGSSSSTTPVTTYGQTVGGTQQVNVAAYNAQYAANYLADASATTGEVAITAAMPVNTFNGSTQAYIADSNVNSNASSDGTDVLANSYQWSLNNVVGAAFSVSGSSVAGALTGAVSLFDANTDAYVSGGTLNTNNFNVLANSAIQSAQVGGALALSISNPLDGSVGISGMAMVNIDKAETSAKVENGATVNDSGDANVNATSSNTAHALATQLAFGTDAGIVGTVAVNVLGNSTNASIDNSTMTVGGTLNVLANDSQTVDDIIGGVGVGALGVAGGVNVTLLQTQVGADIDHSVITNTAGNASGVNVGATSSRNVDNVTGSGAGGIVGVGVSVGVLVAGTGGGIDNDPNTSMLGNSSNNSSGYRGADLTDIGSQGGSSTLASGGSYGNLSSTDVGNINSATNYGGSWNTALAAGTMDGIAAGITGGSKVASSSDVSVTALATEGTTNTAGVGAGGVAAIGVSVASTTLNSQVNALVDGGSSITQARNVNIKAGVADGTGAAASTQVATGSKAGNVTVGALGVNVGVADSSINNTVTAANNGSVTGINRQGALNVAATDSSTASAGNGNPNVTVGIGVAVGTMVYTASRDSTIDAALGAGSTTQNFNNVIVNAADTGGANAQGVAGTGGIISGSGANITATDTSSVTSSVSTPVVGAPASTTTLANNGGVNVTASASPTVTATAKSTTVGIGVAVGVNLANASANLTVNALIGAPASVGAGGSSVVFTQAPNLSVLNVLGTFAPTVTASGTGSVGGIIAANATAVTASSSGSNNAEIGSNVSLPTRAAFVAIAANSTPVESATANGKLGGLLIGGKFTSNASSGESTSAALDNAPSGQALLQLGGLSITATGTDTNDAKTTSGSGALIGGLASTANTSALSSTSAMLGQGWNLEVLGAFNLAAKQSYLYGGTADSHFGALFGGSGAYVSNTLGGGGSTALANIGPNTSVVSGGDLIVQAQTDFSADKNNGGATSGAGGIISGDAAKVNTTLNANDFAHVGSGDTLAAHGVDSNGQMSSVQVLAGAYANNIYDLASISVGGAVPIADAVTDITGNVANTIDIDQGSTIDSWGKVDIATYSQILGVAGQATGNANGLSGVAVSSSKAIFVSNQTINIGSDPGNNEQVPASGNVAVNINSIGGTYVIAGRDILNGRYTQLNPTAIAQAYVRAFIAIPHAAATASAISNATLNMGPGSTANSDSDVAIGSTPGLFAPSADGEGHGYELGFIPATQHSNHTTSQGTANTTLNGSVRAGTPGNLNITIASNGSLTSNSQNYLVNGVQNGSSGTGSSGVPFQAELLNNFNPTAYGSTNPNGLSAWVIGTTVFQTPTSTALPQYGTPLYAQGGNVFLYGGTGGGSGTNTGFLTGAGNVTANGSPSITINNASDTFLVVPGAQVAFGLTGAVDVNDGVTGTSNIGGIAITQTPSTLQPSITINNNYAGTASPGDLILTNTVTNYGGAVTLFNAAGSIITQSINANAVSITAPNGNVAFNATPGDMNWFSGGDPASAADVSGSWFLQMLGNDFLTNGTWDANKIGAAIAQIKYASGSTSAIDLNSQLANYDNPSLVSLPSGPQKTPVVVWSGCMPEINGGPGDGCGGSVKLLSGGSDSYIPFIPWVQLATQSATPPPVVSGSTSASSSRTLTVNACNGTSCGYINIDAPYSVGGAGAWTVQTQQGLQNLITAHQQGQNVQLFDYINGQYVPYQSPVAGNATGSIPLTDGAGNTLYFLSGTSFQPLLGTLASAGNSQLIGASYNLANGGSIVLNNVNANGGGSATLTGHIVSTGNGSLTVNNGYGQVLADNTTGLALQVNNINTGTAQPGVVTFVDSSKTLAGGAPVTTWYLSLSGNAPQIFTNDPNSGGSLVALSTAQSAAMGGATQAYQLASSGNTLSYNPASGQYYNWGVQSQVFRNVYFPGSDPWSFGTPGNGTTPDNAWQLMPGQFSTTAKVALGSTNGTINAYATNMSEVDGNYQYNYAGIAYHGCDKHNNCHYGTTGTGSDGNGHYASVWGFIYPLQGTLEVDVTQNASMPIAVNFNTTQTNRVEVDSNANINLNGIISNTNAPQGTNTPDTLLYATNGGNIFQQNANALIWTHDLAMVASGGGSIGTALNPIQVRIANSGSDPTATLVASTDGNVNGIPANIAASAGGDGSININVDSAAATLPIKAIAQGSVLTFTGNLLNPFQLIPAYGNINISGTGSLVSTNSAGVSVPGQAYLNCLSGLASGNCVAGSAVATNLAQTGEDVVGYAVSLSSSVGGIGAATQPLFVQTHTAMGEQGVLNANAMLGIDMTDDGGDVSVGAIDSQHGDVTLTAPNGGIYDARAESSASTLTLQQQQKIWNQAGLLDGSSAQQVAQSTTSAVNTAYQEYQQLQGMGTINASTGAFTFTLTGNALQTKLAAYWPLAAAYGNLDGNNMPTDSATLQADVTAYLSSRASNNISLFNQWIGTDWSTQAEFTNPSGGYQFALTSAQQTVFNSAKWQLNQLMYSLNASALQAPASGGGVPSSTLTPTTVGTNFIPNISGQNVTLTAGSGGLGRLGAPLAINVADLQNLYQTGQLGGTLKQQTLDALAAANTPGDVVVYDNNGKAIEPQVLANILSNCATATTSCLVGDSAGGVTVGSLSVTQTNPLFLSVANILNGKASGAVYLQALGDLDIGQLTAVGGDMNVAATGNIQAAPGATFNANNPVLQVDNGNLVIAANGAVDFGDSAGDPLPILIDHGQLLKGSASTNLLLSQTHGNLDVNQAVANGLVSLQAPDGNIYAVTGQTTVAGQTIDLSARNNIGYPTTPGTLGALLVQLTGTGGLLNATAQLGALNIAAPLGDLAAGTVFSGQNLTLTDMQGNLSAQQLTSQNGSIFATGQDNASFHTVQANTGVQLDAVTGTLTTTGAVSSNAGSIPCSSATTSASVCLLGNTGIALGGNVTATGGNINAILGNTTGTANVEIAQGVTLAANHGSVSISAPQAGDNLVMDAGAAGNSNIQALRGIVINVGGNAQLGLLQSQANSGDAIDVAAGGAISGNGAPINLQARQGGVSNLTSVNDIGSSASPLTVDVSTLNATSSKGNIYLHGLGTLSVPSLSAFGNLNLAVDQALNFGTMNVGGDALISAASITGITLTTGDSAQIDSTGDTSLGTVDAGTTLAVNVGGNLAATTLQSGGTTNLTAGQAMTLGQATSGGDLTATAGTNLTAATLQSGGAAALTATKGTLQVTNNLTSTGNATLQSGGDTDIQAMTVGGNVASSSGGNTDIAQANVTGTGNLDAAGTLTLGTWTEGGDLTTQSGGDTAIGTLVEGGNLAMTSGGAIDVTQANVTSTGNLNAATNLTLGNWTEAANLTTQSGGNTALGTVVLTAGDLASTAVGALSTQSVNVQQGNATLASQGDMTLGSVTTAKDLTATTAGNLAAATLQSGGATNLTAGQAMTLGQATSGGDMTATAGTNLTAATLQSGGNAALTATKGTLQVTHNLTSTGDATLQSGSDTDIQAMTVGGNVASTSGGNTDITQANVTGTGNLNAAGTLTLGTWNEGGDLTTQSGGDTAIGTLVEGGNLAMTSGGAIDVAQANVTGTGNLNAATNLTLGNWTEAANLTTQSGGNTALGTVVLTAGNLQSTAVGNLTAQDVTVKQGNATLSSGADMNLAKVTTSGTLAATATGTLQATTLSSGGDTNLTSGSDMTLGNAQAGGNLTAKSGGNLAATMLQSGGATNLTAAQAMTLGQATSGGDLTATAGTNLTAATLQSGGNAALTAKTGTLQVTHSLTSTGNATLQSGGDTGIQAMTVGGNVASTSGGNTDITQANVTGTGNLNAAGTLTLGNWTEANNLTTQSGGNTTLGTVVLTAGDLASTAVGALSAQSVNVQQGNATLASQGDMTLGSVTAAKDLTATTAGNLAATTLQSGGATTLTAAQAMTLGQVTSGGDMTATAGSNLTAATLSSGGNAALTAKTGTLQITHSLTSTGNATLQSGSDTDIQAMTVGGNIASTSGGNTDITQANVTGTGNLNAAGMLTLGTWNGGNSLTTQSGAAMALGTVALTSGDLQSTAGTTLNTQQVNVQIGSAMLTAGTDLAANTIAAGTDVDLKAGNTVQTTQVNAGHDINVNAGGDVNMVASTAGHDMNVDSGGALTIHTALAGDAISLAAQQMTFDDVEAPNTVSLWARDGNILANTLRTRDAYAQANGDIVLDAGYIGDRINLQANNITAKVTQTSTGQPLYSVLTGYQGGVANHITVDADASQDWMIDRLAAVVAALTTTAPNADIASGRIMQTMALDTSIAKVRMNQQSALLVPADVQLMQPTYDFQLYQDGIHSLTDAFVVRYSYGFQIQTPNYVINHQWMDPDYLGESALRNNGRFLDTDDLLHGDDGQKHAIPAWLHMDKSQLVQPVNNSQPAVNLQAQVQAPK